MESKYYNILAKVEAYTSTISNLTKGERIKPVFETYARDYNKLLEIFLNTYPAKKDYAPPTVVIDSSTGIVSQVFANYNEILTYTEQIKNLLETIDLESIK